MCEITVIIPTYNRENYLPMAIESVLNQTHKDFTLLICDNASTDGTRKVVDSFDDKRIQYVKRENNVGVFKNCDLAMESCDTEFFVFFSDDDIMDSTLIEEELFFLTSNPSVALVGANNRFIDEKNNVLAYKRDCGRVKLYRDQVIWGKDEYFHQEFTMNHIQFFATGCMGRTSLIKKSEITFSGRNDCGWTEELSLAGCEIAILNKSLFSYRMHAKNAPTREKFPTYEAFEHRLKMRQVYNDKRELADNYEFVFDNINRTYGDMKQVIDRFYTLKSLIEFSEKWSNEIMENDINCLSRDIFQNRNIIEKIKILSIVSEEKWNVKIPINKKLEDAYIWETIIENKKKILNKISDYKNIAIFGSDFNAVALSMFLLTNKKEITCYFDNNYEDKFVCEARPAIVHPTSTNMKDCDLIIVSNLSENSYRAISEQLKSLLRGANVIWWKNI